MMNTKQREGTEIQSELQRAQSMPAYSYGFDNGMQAMAKIASITDEEIQKMLDEAERWIGKR